MKRLTRVAICMIMAFFTLVLTEVITAQTFTFDSGSDESDGALDYTPFAPAQGEDPVTVIFDPTKPETFDHPANPDASRRLDLDGDNVFHFTTITIPAGVTVRMRADTSLGARAVHWLASGAVQIDGVIDLNGESGRSAPISSTSAVAGAGGYGGGIGGTSDYSPIRGFGPGGGGSGNGAHGGGGGYKTAGGTGNFPAASGGSAYGNDFLLPLLGGSGGGGGANSGDNSGGAGGAGGGALLIASSTSITVNGAITARGGNGGAGVFGGGGGSAGGIRLMAPVIGGTGSLNAARGAAGPDSTSTL